MEFEKLKEELLKQGTLQGVLRNVPAPEGWKWGMISTPNLITRVGENGYHSYTNGPTLDPILGVFWTLYCQEPQPLHGLYNYICITQTNLVGEPARLEVEELRGYGSNDCCYCGSALEQERWECPTCGAC